jgi:crotonobetainyl-CoA:carnitine CoA-transferase CaiB-like acyl-CoA transferase
VFETFEPGWMDARGIGYRSFQAALPGLIWTAVTPYGQTSPHAHFKATEISGQAMGGSMYLTGFPGQRPVHGGGYVAEKMAGYVAATAAMFALYYRESTGKGQYIDVSMQEAVAAQTEGVTTRYIYTGDVVTRGSSRARKDVSGRHLPGQ